MRAGVDHAVSDMIVGQVGVGWAGIKGELQDLHAGKAETVAQGLDLGGDDAQVFGNDRQIPQRRTDGFEQASPRRGHPRAALRRPLFGRHLPGRLETAEMIDADTVEQCKCVAEAFDPPVEPLSFQRFPVVERVAPQLAGLAEVVGRYAGYGGRPPLVVQQKEIQVAPDIGRIIGHKDRDIADERHAPAGRICPQRLPLTGKLPLQVFLDPDFGPQFTRGLLVGLSREERRFPGPFLPTFSLVRLFEGHEERKIVQPGRRFAELPELLGP